MPELIHDVRLYLRSGSTNINLKDKVGAIRLSIQEDSFSDAIEIDFVDADYYDDIKTLELSGKENIWLRMRNYFEGESAPQYWEFRFLIEEVSGKNEAAGGSFTLWGRSKLARLGSPYITTISDKTEDDIAAGDTPWIWQGSEVIFAHQILEEIVNFVNSLFSGSFVSDITLNYESTDLEDFYKEQFPIYPGTFSVSNSTPLQVITSVCDILGTRVRNTFDTPGAMSTDPDAYGNLLLKDVNKETLNDGKDWDVVLNNVAAELYDYTYIENVSFSEPVDTPFNNLLVIGPEESGIDFDHTIDLAILCGLSGFEPYEGGYIQAYVGPFLDVEGKTLQEAFDERFEYCLSTETGLIPELSEFTLLEIVSEEVEEEIVISDGVAQATYPMGSPTFNYIGKDLGDVTYSEGYKTIVTTDPYCGVIDVAYTTQYLKFYFLYKPISDDTCHNAVLVVKEKEAENI